MTTAKVEGKPRLPATCCFGVDICYLCALRNERDEAKQELAKLRACLEWLVRNSGSEGILMVRAETVPSLGRKELGTESGNQDTVVDGLFKLAEKLGWEWKP